MLQTLVDSQRRQEDLIVTPEPTAPPTRLLRLPAVLDRVGLRRSRVYDLVAAGQFPAPVRLAARAVAWYEHEVTGWIESRPRARGEEVAQ